MTEPYGDALSEPFWTAAAVHQLNVQRCKDCSRCQFYPRPYCINCQSDAVEWIAVSGSGTVYSLTRVWVDVIDGLTPPYVVALIDLDEGVRLLGNLSGGGGIGSRVRLGWRDRVGAPPIPIFEIEHENRTT